jgi:hypothetical protein
MKSRMSQHSDLSVPRQLVGATKRVAGLTREIP